MSKGMVIIGKGDGPGPSPASAEAAAQEYFTNRVLSGNWAPRPPIERWSKGQRTRFEAELRRLEGEREAELTRLEAEGL